MELYMQYREHGRMILESIEHGPLIWPMIEENGVTRTKKYEELSATKKIQANCDLKATNTILQGLPSKVYSLVNHHKVAKDLWEIVQLLMQGLSADSIGINQSLGYGVLGVSWSRDHAQIRRIFLDGYGVLVVRIVIFKYLRLSSRMLSDFRLDTPYRVKWIRRIGCAYGVLESSGYAGSGIDHYAFLVLSWRRYAVSSLLDTAYSSSFQNSSNIFVLVPELRLFASSSQVTPELLHLSTLKQLSTKSCNNYIKVGKIDGINDSKI
ncbi:hypothetical protein Tco_0711346 [Tanacetum coccineum]